MGGSQTLVFGISHFLPGGGAGPDASPPEKIYYVLAGELTVIAGGKETVAHAGDSVYIGPNESREIINRVERGLHHRGRGRAGEMTPKASWPGLTRPSTSLPQAKTWMPGTRPGMTV